MVARALGSTLSRTGAVGYWGPRPELVRLVEMGELEPSRAIDLGCGTVENVIYLARQGFDATGVDVSSRAIAKARRKARAARVSATFFQGDVTDLCGRLGHYLICAVGVDLEVVEGEKKEK